MKNFKRKLSFLLAAIPMLSNGVASANKQGEKPQENQSTRSESVPGDQLLGGDSGKRASGAEVNDLSEYLPENLSTSEKKIRTIIASNLMERITIIRDTALELISDMTEANFTSNAGSEFTDMLSSVEKVQAETDQLANYMKDINGSISRGNRKEIDNLLKGLESKVLAFDNQLTDIKNRSWPELKDSITKYNSQMEKTEGLKKKSLVTGCKIQSKRVRQVLNNLDSSLQSVVAEHPEMTAGVSSIRKQAQMIMSGLDRLDSKLVSTQSLTPRALQRMKENVGAWEQRAVKLLERYNKILEQATSDTCGSLLSSFAQTLTDAQNECEVYTRMNISRRIMTGQQRETLLGIKEKLAMLFANAHDELKKVSVQAKESSLLSEPMPSSTQQHLENLVNKTVGDAAAQMTLWAQTLQDIARDDESRSQWNPVEMRRIMVNRMTKRCYEILMNKSWNIEKKTNSIVAEINYIQSGTGTMVKPVVRGILEYLTKGTPLTSVGEAVAGNVSGRSWMFAGEGGTGKTSAVELLAAAFNVRLIKINGTNLRSPGRMTEIFREIDALTQPQYDMNNLVNFIVLIDEVDTGVCVATDSTGKSLEFEGSRRQRDELFEIDESHLRKRSKSLTNKTIPWKLKSSLDITDSTNVDKKKNTRKSSFVPGVSSFVRHDEAFGSLSKLYSKLDSNPLSNMFAMISTTNANRRSMPEDVARRLCPPSHEVSFRRATKSEFADIIRNSMPGLSFSDGYSRGEGANMIAEQAEKYGLTPASFVATITTIANSVRKPEDTLCSLPAGALCKLISGSMTEAAVIEEARQLNYEESKKTSNPSNSSERDDLDVNEDEQYAKPHVSGIGGAFAPMIRLTPPRN